MKNMIGRNLSKYNFPVPGLTLSQMNAGEVVTTEAEKLATA